MWNNAPSEVKESSLLEEFRAKIRLQIKCSALDIPTFTRVSTAQFGNCSSIHLRFAV